MNRIIVAVLLQALALSGIAQSPGSPDRAGFARAGVEAPQPPTPEQQLLTLLNVERRSAHLAALQWDAKVAEAAQAHSQRLADHRALSHQFTGEPELLRRISVTGVRFSSVAENVAVAEDPGEAHMALMNSPGHRANILNPDYNAVGISVTRVGRELYVTEDFAHVVATYSEEDFRKGVIAAFNHLRLKHNLGPIDAHSDPALDRQACMGDSDLGNVLLGTNHPTRATMFNAAEPSNLPHQLDRLASDVSLRRMNVGVCFRSAATNPFPDFSVIVAFYQIN